MQEEIVDDFVVVHHHKDTHEVPEYAAAAPPGLSDIGAAVDGLAEELWPVNKKIHDNPELGFKEFIAHETLTTLMRSKAGWKVTPSAYGMATAWVAAYDSGKRGPVVSFNVEMGSFLFPPKTLVQETLSIINWLANAGCFISLKDALQGIGHACGHNLIATSSVAAGLATAEIMKQRNLGGKVVLFGTPAEEGW